MKHSNVSLYNPARLRAQSITFRQKWAREREREWSTLSKNCGMKSAHNHRLSSYFISPFHSFSFHSIIEPQNTRIGFCVLVSKTYGMRSHHGKHFDADFYFHTPYTYRYRRRHSENYHGTCIVCAYGARDSFASACELNCIYVCVCVCLQQT